MKIQIDCYGFEATSEHFQKRKLEAFLVKDDGGIVYACFGTGDMRPIHRIDKDSVPEVTFAVPTGETFSFEERDDGTFACVTGVNVFAFNETLEIEREG